MHAQSEPQPASLRQDARTIGLVGLVHGTSHFFHLLLPPLFPFFISEFGLSYSQLGLLVTVFFVISGVGQALSGFVVDRIGARPVLIAALCCFVLAALSAAGARGYAGLMAASALAGLGNAPFHPADFTILNRRVSPARLGHAYSVHGISGNLGWAVSPLFTAGLVGLTGSIRIAYLGVAALAVVVLAIVLLSRDSLNDRAPGAPAATGTGHGSPGAGKPEHVLAFLRLPSIWLCFSFLFFTTCALSAIQSFASPALHQLHDLPLTWSGLVVSGYMVCGAIGMVAGGFLLTRFSKLEPLIAVTLVFSGLLLLLAVTPWVSGLTALALVSLAGLGTGLAGPSRDMLIRRAAPPGASGRVYGLVYSGLDLGFALSAPVFGHLLDAGQAAAIFEGSALALLAAVMSAALVGRSLTARVTAPTRTA